MMDFSRKPGRLLVFIIALLFLGVFIVSSSALAEDSAEDSVEVAVFSGASGGGSSKGGGGSGGAGTAIFTGASTNSIAIAVPPGRLGVAPNIAISYNSRQGDGWIGVGWNYDMGSIQRDPEDLDYNGDDFLYGAATLIKVTETSLCSNEYRAKIEDGSFIRFCRDITVNTWTGYDKNGMKYYFGRDLLSRQDNPADPSQVFQWKLDRVEDANGNYMEMTYEKDLGQIYLKEIKYTGNTGLQPTKKVVFITADRTNPFPVYTTNFEVINALQLQSIETYAYDPSTGVEQLAAKYDFEYAESGITKRIVLQKVIKDGTELSNGVTLPATEFTYNDATDEANAFLSFKKTTQGYTFGVNTDAGSLDLQRFRPGDFNGDGKTDFMYISRAPGVNSIFYISNGDSFTTAPFPFSYAPFQGGRDLVTNRFMFGDFNGDGKTDFLVINRGFVSSPYNESQPNTLYLANVDENGVLSFIASGGQSPTFPTYLCPPTEQDLTSPYWHDHANDGYINRFKTGDFNGDGKTDIFFIQGVGGTQPASIYLATGSEDDISFSSQIPANSPSSTIQQMCPSFGGNVGRFAADRSKIEFQKVRVGDFNGDGKSDVHVIRADTSAPSEIYFSSVDDNDILSFIRANGPSLSVSSFYYHSDTCNATYYASFRDLGKIRYGEFNGDKRTDIFLIKNNQPADIYFGTGDASRPFDLSSGVGTGPSFPVSTDHPNFEMIDLSRIKMGDFNGDGRTDLLRVNGWGSTAPLGIYLSEGDGFHSINSYAPDHTDHSFHVSLPVYLGKGCNDPSGSQADVSRFIFGDFRGNGKTDFLYISGTTKLYTAKPDASDVIKKVKTAAGGEITLEYEPSTDFDNDRLPFSIPLLTSLEVNPMTDGSDLSETLYDYAGGYFDMEDKEFRGFGYVKQTNPDGSTLETWFHQKDDINTGDDEDFAGRAYRTELRKPWPDPGTPGELLSSTDMGWEKVTVPGISPDGIHPLFPKMTTKDITTYKPDQSVELFSSEVYAYNDTNGTIASVFTSGDGAEDITTVNTYANKGTWLWRKTATTVSGSLSGQVRKQTFGYEPGTGNMLWKEFWLENGSNPRVSFEYHPEGNVWKGYDAQGNPPTETTYDDDTKTYPVRVVAPQTNGVDHIVRSEYDYRFGSAIKTWDENGNMSENILDEFGRTVETIAYDGDGPVIMAKSRAFYSDTGDPNAFPRYTVSSALESINGATESYMDAYKYVDGIGRPVQAVAPGDGGRYIVSRTYYDNMGRSYLAEGPYFSTAALQYPMVPDPAYHDCDPDDPDNNQLCYPWGATTQYDYHGRPEIIQSSDGEHGVVEITISYAGLSTTVTDPDGKKKTETKDYLGRIVEVIEHVENNVQQTTYYEYNAAGDLTKVTDAASTPNITTISYDTLGRKIDMQDPDMGFWQYRYDENGNLCKQMDAKGQIIHFTYDVLNRVLSKAYFTTTVPSTLAYSCNIEGTASVTDYPVFYTYDNASIPNGKGRLYSVDNTNVVSRVDTYDSLGRTTSASKKIVGDLNWYTTQTSYDLAGRPTVMVYPDGDNDPINDFSVTYNYLPQTGILNDVTGSDGVTYAEFSDLTPSGKISHILFGNGVTSDYGYDRSSERMFGITTVSPTANNPPFDDIISTFYSYTAAGNISKIINFKKGALMGITNNEFTYNYDYDDLHRLKNERAPETLAEMTPGNLSYDPHPSIAHTFQAVTVMNTGNSDTYDFTYDENGNMTNGWGFLDKVNPVQRDIVYNADNMPVEITYRGSTTNFVYDGAGSRARKIGSTETYYIGAHFEIINGKHVRYIFAGGLRIAMVEKYDTHYFHKDHLGSTIGITNDAGAVVWSTNYTPYGEQREEWGIFIPSNYRYTDQEYDPETGLYNYDARMYDASIGKFITPDTIIPSLFNPQSLNRYAYALNNPLKFVDPNGHSWEIVVAVAIIVGATAGAVSAGIQSDWDIGAMVKGAIIGAVAGGIGAGVGAVVGPLVGTTATGALTAGGAIAGGAAGGAVAGAFVSMINGGNILEGALYGAIAGAIGGAIGAGGWSTDPTIVAMQIAASGVVSGVMTELSGGQFLQGFMIGAGSAAVGYGIARANAKNERVLQGRNASKKAKYSLISTEDALKSLEPKTVMTAEAYLDDGTWAGLSGGEVTAPPYVRRGVSASLFGMSYDPVHLEKGHTSKLYDVSFDQTWFSKGDVEIIFESPLPVSAGIEFQTSSGPFGIVGYSIHWGQGGPPSPIHFSTPK